MISFGMHLPKSGSTILWVTIFQGLWSGEKIPQGQLLSGVNFLLGVTFVILGNLAAAHKPLVSMELGKGIWLKKRFYGLDFVSRRLKKPNSLSNP